MGRKAWLQRAEPCRQVCASGTLCPGLRGMGRGEPGVCVCTHGCVHAYAYTCARICLCMCRYACGYVQTLHMCVSMHVCACMHVSVRVYVYMCVCICLRVCVCVSIVDQVPNPNPVRGRQGYGNGRGEVDSPRKWGDNRECWGLCPAGSHAHRKGAGVAPCSRAAACWNADPGLSNRPIFQEKPESWIFRCDILTFKILLSAHQGDLKCLLDQTKHTQGWNLACTR